jgi:hypothetical protein
VAVDFATPDVSAQQRADYTAGTLAFGPGETSKTFSVSIVDDLSLEGNETLNLTLSNPVGGAQLNSPGVATQRMNVSNAFIYEQEYQQTGAYVFRLYRAAFGNNQPSPNPDNSNQSESKKLPSYSVFAPDRAQVRGGSNMAAGQQSIADAFVQRSAFVSKYPANQDGPTFVEAVLANIKNDTGVDLTSQRTALITLFNSGGRSAVLYRLADDNALTNPINNRAFIDEEYNRAFVTTQYFGYLRRDADIGGFSFWLGQVDSAPLRDTSKQHAMVCAFVTATEYQLRFSPMVTHSNADCQ